MPEHSEGNQRWNAQLEEFRQSNSYRELGGIDGEPIEIEWKISPGLTSLEILQKIQKDLQRGKSEKCISNSEQVTDYAKRFSRGHWSFLGPGDDEKWYGTLSYTPEGNDSIATEMVGHSKETGHPVFKGISALSRGILRRKGSRFSIHFNADSSNTDLLCRTIHSANQLSVHVAVSSWCEEFAQKTPNQQESTSEKFVAKEK